MHLLSRAIVDSLTGFPVMPHYTVMSNRSWSTEALVLSLTPFGEGHREALLLTETRGLVHAAVFGGAKSKLRSLVSPYQTGTVWIYADPVKKSAKITDFDVHSYRPGIRESLVRTWCAALCAELVTRSHGIADWRLVNGFLDGIAVAGDDECRRGLLRFIWRILGSAGISPDIGSCVRCGAPLGGEKDENAVLYYSPYEEACVCEACVRNEERRFPLSTPARAYLAAVDTASPALVRTISLTAGDYADLRQFLFFLASRMIDGPLKTLETGDGIL
jgi:DNA repair protein RecO (recombination protein O)